MTFGDQLARLRKENNYTQEQLAHILGVSRQAVSKWESGTAFPEIVKLISLSEIFGVSVDFLVKNYMKAPEASGEVSMWAMSPSACLSSQPVVAGRVP